MRIAASISGPDKHCFVALQLRTYCVGMPEPSWLPVHTHCSRCDSIQSTNFPCPVEVRKKKKQQQRTALLPILKTPFVLERWRSCYRVHKLTIILLVKTLCEQSASWRRLAFFLHGIPEDGATATMHSALGGSCGQVA